ncbi:MAG: LysE family transporter [Gammaproteobacteria bacterium]|nr:LysE family transporter [Gammaproteobacteria bacterium]
MYLAEFLTIAIAHLFAVASPGPDFAIVLRYTVVGGKRAGLWTSLGIAAGILLHVSYGLLGIGLLIASSEILFGVLKLLAAVYLVYLGIKGIRESFRHPGYKLSAGEHSYLSAGSLIFTGFLTNGLNPKATLFFLAIFTLVIEPGTPMLVQLGYGIYLSIATFIWFALLSLLLGMEPVKRIFLSRGRWFDRALGIVLIALGIQLLITTAP